MVGGHGTLTTAPVGPEYAEGQLVALQATPEAGFAVDRWTGTDNDRSTALSNTVTMISNKTVTVAFGPVLGTLAGRVIPVGYRGDNTSICLAFEFQPEADGDLFTRIVPLNADGSFRVPDLPEGTYTLTIRGDCWLSAVVNNVTVAGTTVLSQAILLEGGDFNGDGRVTFEDFSLLQNNYGSRGSESLSAASPIESRNGAAGIPCGGMSIVLGLSMILGVLPLKREDHT